MIHCYPPSLFYKLQKKKNLVRWLIDKSFKKVTGYQVLLESYKNVVDTTKSITYNDKEVIIGGFGSELVTVPIPRIRTLESEFG